MESWLWWHFLGGMAEGLGIALVAPLAIWAGMKVWEFWND